MNPLPSSTSFEILIPVRNGGEPLTRTLKALLASEDQDYRVLISDNYSTDGSPWKQALDAFQPGQVTLVQPPEPLGRVEHWTWIAQQATAPYCKLLLCGDRFQPDYIGAIRRAFALQPDLIYTPYIILGRGNTFEEELSAIDLRDEIIPLTGDEYLARCASEANAIGPLSDATFRTATLQEALPFDASHPWTADWRLFSRIMRTGTAVCCHGTYCIQDRTIARLSSSFKGILNGIFEEKAFQRELAGKPPATGFSLFRETFPAVAGLILKRSLPDSLVRQLSASRRTKRESLCL